MVYLTNEKIKNKVSNEKIKKFIKIFMYLTIIFLIILLLIEIYSLFNRFIVDGNKNIIINNGEIFNNKEIRKLVDLLDDIYTKDTNIVVIKEQNQLIKLLLEGKIPLTFGQVLDYYIDRDNESLQGRTFIIKKNKSSSYWIFIFESSTIFENNDKYYKKNAFIRVLYHELRHVYQFKNDENIVKKYKDIPYNKKPYEIDAEDFQIKIRKSYSYFISQIIN